MSDMRQLYQEVILDQTASQGISVRYLMRTAMPKGTIPYAAITSS
jgi:hypothetical protein